MAASQLYPCFILAAEQALHDTKLKGLKRQERVAQSMDEAKMLQDEIRKVEGEHRRRCQEILPWKTKSKPSAILFDALEKRLHRASRTHTPFTVRWTLN